MGDAERRKVDFAKGYLLGLSGMPVATTPAAASDPLYLYGGFALPPFPAEWDRVTYPHAVISFFPYRREFYLCVYKNINYYEVPSKGNHCFGTQENGTALVFTCKLCDVGWSQKTDTQKGILVDRDKIHVGADYFREVVIWANFDLKYSDNTLYVGKSMPERITDWDALKGKYFYNNVVLPWFKDEDGWGHYDYLIMKHETEDVYIRFGGIWVGYYCYRSSGEVVMVPDNIYTCFVHTCPAGGDLWEPVDDDFSYFGEARYNEEYNWYEYCIGKFENVVWAENGVGYLDNDYTAFFGSEPVPVPEPAEVNTDNKAIVLGCRLGYIVRKQMQKVNMPDGVLTTSDGYILKDSNGLYLCAMKGE